VRHRFRAVRLGLIAGLTLTALFAIAAASPAAAICARLMGDPVWEADAESVFIGTAVDVRAFGQNALFHVEESWEGDPLPEWQDGTSIDDENGIWSTTPRFTVGARYLVVGHWHEGKLRPQGCGATQEYTQAVADLRPADVTQPTPSSRPMWWGSLWALFSVVNNAFTVIVFVGVLVLATLLWRQRSRVSSADPDSTA
jgi:hypothetical protein